MVHGSRFTVTLFIRKTIPKHKCLFHLNKEKSSVTTVRRAYENNPRLTSFEIGQAIGRSRQAVDAYIADLRAATQMELDLKTFRMNRLEIPQERIARRLGQARETIRNHLAKMPALANQPKTNLSRGFTVAQVAEKHGWRDFQNTPAKNETRVNSILINDYLWILNQSGWQETHIFQAPLSSERFKANVVSAMQKRKIIGVTSRYVIISKKK